MHSTLEPFFFMHQGNRTPQVGQRFKEESKQPAVLPVLRS